MVLLLLVLVMVMVVVVVLVHLLVVVVVVLVLLVMAFLRLAEHFQVVELAAEASEVSVLGLITHQVT